jgi:hypothetical protein
MRPHNELLTYSTLLGLVLALTAFSIPGIIHNSRKCEAERTADRVYGNNDEELSDSERQEWYSDMNWALNYIPTSSEYRNFTREHEE